MVMYSSIIHGSNLKFFIYTLYLLIIILHRNYPKTGHFFKEHDCLMAWLAACLESDQLMKTKAILFI